MSGLITPQAPETIVSLSERSREVFRTIVETYLETGEPVGSRFLSRSLPMQVSPATIRNVMADLEEMGLLTAPHTSAGRLPTQVGLRLFLDGLLQVGDLRPDERASIEMHLSDGDRSVEDLLTEATTALSGLSHCAGLVVVPKRTAPLRHIEFVDLSPDEALSVLVYDDGSVENRMIRKPKGMTISDLVQATNFLNHKMRGRTLEQARAEVKAQMSLVRDELSGLTKELVEAGLATWSPGHGNDEAWSSRTLIIRGQSNLLEDLAAVGDIERVRHLFNDLEKKHDVMQLLEQTKEGEGVRIFIGSESNVSSLSASSVIAAPFFDQSRQIIGAVGVIGPTRLNYARIIPLVDYTAQIVGRIMTSVHG